MDISIDIDKYFIEKQGGNVEDVVEYINFLVSAANVIFEHEVDAHCEFCFLYCVHYFSCFNGCCEIMCIMDIYYICITMITFCGFIYWL